MAIGAVCLCFRESTGTGLVDLLTAEERSTALLRGGIMASSRISVLSASDSKLGTCTVVGFAAHLSMLDRAACRGLRTENQMKK